MDFVYHRTYRGPVRAVILDWAGTTLDYGCYAPAVVFIDVFKSHGVDITIEEAREPMGTHKKEHIRRISKSPTVAKKWQEVHGSACSEQDVEIMYEEFIPRQMKCLAEYADLIPGTLEAVEQFRRRNLKIGSTTGYNVEMMDLLTEEAKKRGYAPDCVVCAAEVPAGRPAPWMCLRNAEALDVYPLEAIVKIGDTIPDIDEGLNAGMWTIGLALVGNEMGLLEEEIKALAPEEREHRLTRARTRLYQAGSHYVVDGLWNCDPIIEEINTRLARGEKP